jgi:hypothetical protein
MYIKCQPPPTSTKSQSTEAASGRNKMSLASTRNVRCYRACVTVSASRSGSGSGRRDDSLTSPPRLGPLLEAVSVRASFPRSFGCLLLFARSPIVFCRWPTTPPFLLGTVHHALVTRHRRSRFLPSSDQTEVFSHSHPHPHPHPRKQPNSNVRGQYCVFFLFFFLFIVRRTTHAYEQHEAR